MSHFELTLKGFNGGDDQTDHLIVWVSAPVTTISEMRVKLQQLGLSEFLEDVARLEGSDKVMVSEDIDFYLPSQEQNLVAHIKKLAAENDEKKWGVYYNIVKNGGAVIEKPNEERAELMRKAGYDPERPQDVLSYLDSIGVIDFCVSIKEADD
jgi:hypothetical protein